MSHTQEIPMAPVRLVPPLERNGCFDWEVTQCPYCGLTHRHGAGKDADDVLGYLGYRLAHCAGNNKGNYQLLPIEAPPVDPPSKLIAIIKRYYEQAKGDMSRWPMMEKALIEQGPPYQRRALRVWQDYARRARKRFK